ncbi:SPX domain-containing protein [Terfezia claveryi]|nr:SPX domain-containing protein [Terfezia claveryi]
MKFAKGLEETIVPEWRVKYIDYKGGKKRIKCVAKVIKLAEASPAVNSLYINSLLNRAAAPNALPSKSKGKGDPNSRFKWMPSLFSTVPTCPIPTLTEPPTEYPSEGIDTPLAGAARQLMSLSTGQRQDALSTTQYGTISSPPEGISGVPIPPPSLQLPEPMQPLYHNNSESEARSGKIRHIHGGPDISITKRKLFSFHKNKRLTSFTMANSHPTARVPAAAIVDKVDGVREEAIENFFRWLEAELRKIDTFYKIKEDEAARKLEELREQLHIMRDMRSAELRAATGPHSSGVGSQKPNGGGNLQQHKPSHNWNLVARIRYSFFPELPASNERKSRVAPATSQLVPDLRGYPPAGLIPNGDSIPAHAHEHSAFLRKMTPGQRDYAVHRKPMNEITYRVAKRKLKIAMIEYYRGLELLKSYCHQNQEGLRKIIKKFDKATGLRTSKRFTTEKISKSYFGSSDILETLIHQTEDLFSRYFARGDKKHAIERLRTGEKSREFYGSTFRSGILLGLGVFAIIHGMMKAVETKEQSLYLLQIWGGLGESQDKLCVLF